MTFRRRLLLALVKKLKPHILQIINEDIRVWGDERRLTIAPTARMVNTLFNTSGGTIVIGDLTFTGHNVSIITGAHNYQSFMEERMGQYAVEGRDIVIGRGVWIGSNAVILGPAHIGDHSVIAAGALVLAGSNIPPLTIFAGVPARQIKTISPAPTADNSLRGVGPKV